MTPVILLTDGYLSNSTEPWLIPDINNIKDFPVEHCSKPDGFHPFLRDKETLARNWAIPGTPGLEHRIGGIEKSFDSGHISYDADNHQKMTDARIGKIRGISEFIPLQEFEEGNQNDDLVVVGWGSTYGPINRAVSNLRDKGFSVAQIHLTYISPFPKNLGKILSSFKNILVPEMNAGQLVNILRSEYLVPASGLNKVEGKPFKISEIEDAIKLKMKG
tara:strand:- start:280 stop:933 length:654 start_codon:yes stop_codon:yes gene_type:complete